MNLLLSVSMFSCAVACIPYSFVMAMEDGWRGFITMLVLGILFYGAAYLVWGGHVNTWPNVV